MTRRGFLASSGRMFAGMGLVGGFVARSARAGTAEKLCVGVRDVHLREVGEVDAWGALRAIGAEGVEAVVEPDFSCPSLSIGGTAYSIATEESTKRLAEDAATNKIRVTSFCLANRFDERPDEELKWVSLVVRACRQLGVEAIRIDVVPRRIKDDEEFLKFAAGILKRVVEATADSGVRFGIENHGGMSNRVEFLEKLFEAVGSDRLGLTLDTGNLYWFGTPLSELYKIYEKFARRVFHTHCKSIAYPKERREERREMGWEYGKYNCPIDEGDIDFRRVLAILRAANYRGDLCIENESLSKFPGEKRREVLAREIAFLRGLL